MRRQLSQGGGGGRERRRDIYKPTWATSNKLRTRNFIASFAHLELLTNEHANMSHHYPGYDYHQQPAYALPAAPPSKAPRATQQPHPQHYAYAPSTHAPSSLDSSSYAGSAEDDGDVDMVELLTQRLQGAFDPLVLDRGLVVQAQTYALPTFRATKAGF